MTTTKAIAEIINECWMVIGNIYDNPELLKTE